ncbi:MAG: hypothetical protein COY09_00580 [Candidatus Portnoybacteria bacterium CG_4_10_14_0_2_um_filter_39_11]|uniref:Transposase IS200-like domain-containing protein n=1 Tax=Candidatus Portnoybacteria bacterium CG_4_10_14_0_2_um_filter_39_11 TaxID=1974797 RepID=A0A2M7UJP5_9BACT|nr:MAG: hypothetical protein COY09_00580 [Candidatus Portnoybacteria bacterium CG_4_10_14_0_2_um_filter_39_11]
MFSVKNRRLNRLEGYDYSRGGWYFVTLCVRNYEYLLGDITGGKMRLSEIGKIAQKCWSEISKHFPDTDLDEFIVMLNHIHGIIVIRGNTVGNKNFCSLQQPWQKHWARSLSSVVRGFKIGVTKWCCQNNNQNFAWQKSFYDHIIRNEKSLFKIREYIVQNLLKWEFDRNNKDNVFV